MMGGYGLGFGMSFGWIIWLVILVVVLYVVFGFVRRSSSQLQSGLQSQPAPPVQVSETPLAILKRRYAAGEIDQTQFDAMKNQLG